MASVEACRVALDQLSALLGSVDPELRERHVPRRSVVCRLTDIDHTFQATLTPDGLEDLREGESQDGPADVRVTMTSEELVALARGDEDFLHGWLRGRIQVSASMRDLLRLRSLFGL